MKNAYISGQIFSNHLVIFLANSVKVINLTLTCMFNCFIFLAILFSFDCTFFSLSVTV